MSTVNMLDAKTRLSKLVEAVESGVEREIIIARNGKPAARLVPIEAKRRPIRLGLAKERLGSFDFLDDPEGEREMQMAWAEFLNEDILSGEDITPVEELHRQSRT